MEKKPSANGHWLPIKYLLDLYPDHPDYEEENDNDETAYLKETKPWLDDVEK